MDPEVYLEMEAVLSWVEFSVNCYSFKFWNGLDYTLIFCSQ